MARRFCDRDQRKKSRQGAAGTDAVLIRPRAPGGIRSGRAARAALAAGLLLCGCGGGREERPAGQPADAIVRVGDAVLTEEHLERLLPDGERMPFSIDEKTAWVERWIEMEVLYREALRRGLHRDPIVRARLESLEREFLADHLVFIELRERIVVTDEDVEEYFDQHRDEYLHEYRVSHIMLNTLEEARAAQELLKTRSFAWVANTHSVDPVARRGGDLGYLTKGNMIPAFETVVFDMRPGDVSDIIESDFGYHILMLADVREARVKVELDDVRAKLMNELVLSRREAAYRNLVERLAQQAEVEYLKREYLERRTAAAPDEEAAREDAAREEGAAAADTAGHGEEEL